METRNQKRKMEEQDLMKKKQEMQRKKVMLQLEDNQIGENDIIVSRSTNEVKLESGDKSTPMKEEVGREDVPEVDVKVVTVEEKVYISQDPSCDLEGSAGLVNVPESGISSQPLGISSDRSAASFEPWEQKFNYLVNVTTNLTAELNALKEKVSKSSSGKIPPQPPTCATGTSTQNGQPQGETDDVMEVDTDSGPATLPNGSSESSQSEMGTKHCLICDTEVRSKDDLPVNDKQCDAIFILNQLLCLPSTSLGKYADMCPDANLGSWINLCSECEEKVAEAWKIYEEIMDATRRFTGIQQEVVQKIKISTVDLQVADVCGSRVEASDIGEVVTQESRRFAIEHDYGCFLDRFAPRDLEAYRRLVEEKMMNKEKLSEKSNEMPLENGVVSMEQDKDVNSEETSQGDHSPTDSSNEGSASSSGVQHGNDLKMKSVDPAPRKKKSRSLRINEQDAFFGDDGKVFFRCPVEGCSKAFKTKQHYQLHKLRHSGENPTFPCDKCEKIFISRSGLYAHRTMAHEKKVPNYIKKMREERKLKNIKCPHCKILTRDKSALAAHIKIVHEKSFSFHCGICRKGLSCPSHLRYHKTEVHGICSVEGCEIAIPGDRKGLRNHQLEAHGKEIDVLACQDCGKLFFRVGILHAHQKQCHRKGCKE